MTLKAEDACHDCKASGWKGQRHVSRENDAKGGQVPFADKGRQNSTLVAWSTLVDSQSVMAWLIAKRFPLRTPCASCPMYSSLCILSRNCRRFDGALTIAFSAREGTSESLKHNEQVRQQLWRALFGPNGCGTSTYCMRCHSNFPHGGEFGNYSCILLSQDCCMFKL
jgi:hypothetical protein